MNVLLVLDLLGVFAFAWSGAAAAVAARLDLLGVLFVSTVAALAGGLTRDVLLGDVPPAALQDPRYLCVPIIAGVAAFLGASRLHRVAVPVQVFDAAGLGLFVATGTTGALDAGLGALPAVTLGLLSGIGGGIARDLLVGVVPIVLRRELYATPALLGAAAVVAGDGLDVPRAPVAGAAAGLVLTVRLLSVWFDWHVPRAPLDWDRPRKGR